MSGHLSWQHNQLCDDRGMVVGYVGRNRNGRRWRAVLFKEPARIDNGRGIYGQYRTSCTLDTKQEARAWLIATHRLLG